MSCHLVFGVPKYINYSFFNQFLDDLNGKYQPPLSQGITIKMEPESSSEAEEDETLSVHFHVKEEGDAGDTFDRPGRV